MAGAIFRLGGGSLYEVLKVGNVHPSGKGMNGNVFDVNGGLCPTLTTNKGEGIKFLFNETEETGMNDLSMYAEYLVHATRERLGYDTYDDSNDDRVLAELQRGEKISKSKHVQHVKKSFTYASAFAGIGGMTLGLKPLGGVGVAAWEYDPTEKRTQYAQDAHRLLHPEIPLYGDICEANTDELPDFDVFCFTPPCQSFSVAGKRGGFEDTRGTLTFEALRIANAKRPKILFMENVKGLVNHDAGNTMGTIIHAINEIGYTVDFTVLNSKYFDVAQNRERVYLIAVRDDLITPEPWVDVKGSTMLPKAKAKYLSEGVRSFNFDWPEQTEVRTRLRDFLEDSVDERYYLSEDKTAALVAQLEANDYRKSVVGDVTCINPRDVDGNQSRQQDRIYEADGCMTTLQAQLSGRFNIVDGIPIREATKQGYTVAAVGDAVNITFPNSATRRGRVGKQMANTIEASGINQGVVERVGNVHPSGNGMNGNVYSIDAGLSPTLTTNKGEGVKMLEEIRPVLTPERLEKHQNGRRFKEDGEEAFTLTSIDRHGVAIGEYPRYRIRKLTPTECLRLQSVPSDAIETLKAHFSDSRLYKFAGNGLTTNVIRAIGERLLTHL